MRIHFTRISRNTKTGPIAVTTSSEDTCPPSCPLYRNGCYAGGGPLRLHWDHVSTGTRGGTLDEACAEIAKLPKGAIWRHNQAGDLPGLGERIDPRGLRALTAANARANARGFTYTHKRPTARNLELIREAIAAGFTINLSANGPKDADRLARIAPGVPLVTILPKDAVRYKTAKTPAGRTITICPATYSETDCARCQLCQRSNRRAIVGLPVHGSGTKKAAAVIAKN